MWLARNAYARTVWIEVIGVWFQELCAIILMHQRTALNWSCLTHGLLRYSAGTLINSNLRYHCCTHIH